MSQWEMLLMAVGFAWGIAVGGIACSLKQIIDVVIEDKEDKKRRKVGKYGSSLR